jgi:short-subunit dehydrogenase
MYNGIKSFFVNLSEALNLELQPYNIRCTAVCPGMTKTNFPKAMGAEAFFDRIPQWRWMTSEQVAREGLLAAKQGKAIYIPGRVNRLVATFFDVIPRSLKQEMGKRGIVL